MEPNRKYEVLKSLPAYGPMHICISESGEQFYSEGFVVRFIKDDQTEWVANFATGWGIDKVFDYPDKNLVIIFASGIGYVMNPNNEEPLLIIGSMTKEIFQTDSGDLICIDDIGIQIFNPNNSTVWISERISWDGFKDLTFENGIIKGKSYDPTNSIQEWSDFSFNYENKVINGGSFRIMLENNPHLEMKNRIEVKNKSDK